MKTSVGLACCVGLALNLTFAGSLIADDLQDAANKFCDKLKSCTYQQLEDQKDAPAEAKQMMEQAVQQSCDSMKEDFEALAHPELRGPALKCLQSLADLDCKAMEEGTETAACAELEALMEKMQPADQAPAEGGAAPAPN